MISKIFFTCLMMNIYVIYSHPLILEERSEECEFGIYSLEEIQRNVNKVHQDVLYKSNGTICLYEMETRNILCNLDLTGRQIPFICRNPLHDIYRNKHSHLDDFLPSSESNSHESDSSFEIIDESLSATEDNSHESDLSLKILHTMENNQNDSEVNSRLSELDESFEILNVSSLSYEEVKHNEVFSNISIQPIVNIQEHNHDESNIFSHIMEILSLNQNNSEIACKQDIQSGYVLCLNMSECKLGILEYQFIKDLNQFKENILFLINEDLCGFNIQNQKVLCPPEKNFEGRYVCVKKEGIMDVETWKVVSNVGDLEGIDVVFRNLNSFANNFKSVIFALDCHHSQRNTCSPKVSFLKI